MVYRVDRNNFYKKQKLATIYTPSDVSEFLYEIVSPLIQKGLIFDPCVGAGALLVPFVRNGYDSLGLDVENQGFEGTIVENFLEFEAKGMKKPSLVIMNPPFNIDEKTKDLVAKNYGRRPLLPEVWLSRVIDLFGSGVPIVMFTPYGFRLNLTTSSKRWRKFIDSTYPEISSIVSLPKNVFKEVLFHSEILIFNIKGLKPHYFYDELRGN